MSDVRCKRDEGRCPTRLRPSPLKLETLNLKTMKKSIIEIAVKMLVAALTAFLTAVTTTSCAGYGPITMM